jgi:integrase
VDGERDYIAPPHEGHASAAIRHSARDRQELLGHADLQSTEVYVQADLAMKSDARAKVGGPHSASTRRARLSPNLITWLESL